MNQSNHADDGPIRVLIVDDHPLARAGLRAMLNKPDIDIVGEGGNGADAIQMAVDLSPDIVFLDIAMPDMDGLTATREIKKKVPGASVIIITGVERAGHLRKAIEAGAAGYLLKGASRDLLLQSVRLLKAGGSLIDKNALLRLADEAGDDLAPNSFRSILEILSPREAEVLRYLVNGMTNKEIADQMSYSVGTVKNVVQRIIDKLGVTDRTQAAVWAVRAGIDTG